MFVKQKGKVNLTINEPILELKKATKPKRNHKNEKQYN